MPSSKTVSQIQAALLHPATTSHYYVEIQKPDKVDPRYWSSNGLDINSVNLDKLNLMCCEATLPGSNLATLEVTNDFHGVTERHAYRRVYDDRIDFTFYVDAENYLPIRFFEVWIKFIAQETADTPQPGKGNLTSRNSNYFYRFNYPENYIAKQGTKITKFERSTYGTGSKGDIKKRGSVLTYEFINVFPISISSMPISYDASSLLKCTVSMSYIRYIVNTPDPFLETTDEGGQNPVQTPQQQASLNSLNNQGLYQPDVNNLTPSQIQTQQYIQSFDNSNNPEFDLYGSQYSSATPLPYTQ